jgi:hypothetical protein
MILTLRAFFLGRLLREKILLIALALGVAIFWFSDWSGRVGKFWTEQRHTTSDLKTQALWLNNRAAIERAGTAATAQLNQADTLDSNKLVAAVNGLATDAGLKFQIGAPADESLGQFAVHTVPLTMSGVAWEALLPFYVNLQHRAPYITIESMGVVAAPGDPKNLNVAMKISSVEVVRSSP